MTTRLSDIARSRKGFHLGGGLRAPGTPLCKSPANYRLGHGAEGEGRSATFSSTWRDVPAKLRRTSSTPCHAVAEGKPEVVGGWSSAKPGPPEIQKGGVSLRPARR